MRAVCALSKVASLGHRARQHRLPIEMFTGDKGRLCRLVCLATSAIFNNNDSTNNNEGNNTIINCTIALAVIRAAHRVSRPKEDRSVGTHA